MSGVEHFKKTLNDLDIRTDAITTEETAAVIKLLENGNALGMYMVSAEMLKHISAPSAYVGHRHKCKKIG